jgi:hypothetical protein
VSARIEDLNIYFQPIVREVILRANAEGLYPFMTQGRRSRELQACIYARGRVSAGKSATYGTLTVHTFISKDRKNVVARCGAAEYAAPIGGWDAKVTKVLDSWHTEGLAGDFGFRSGPGALDDIIPALERAKKWKEIRALYMRLHAIWLEVCPEIRWGFDWNQNGVPVDEDPLEKGALRDMPHWEWHPGRTLAQVRAGILPPFPTQCKRCRGFRSILVDDVCRDCLSAAFDAKCVGVRR